MLRAGNWDKSIQVETIIEKGIVKYSIPSMLLMSKYTCVKRTNSEISGIASTVMHSVGTEK
jgi:hypothetical protein